MMKSGEYSQSFADDVNVTVRNRNEKAKRSASLGVLSLALILGQRYWPDWREALLFYPLIFMTAVQMGRDLALVASLRRQLPSKRRILESIRQFEKTIDPQMADFYSFLKLTSPDEIPSYEGGEFARIGSFLKGAGVLVETQPKVKSVKTDSDDINGHTISVTSNTIGDKELHPTEDREYFAFRFNFSTLSDRVESVFLYQSIQWSKETVRILRTNRRAKNQKESQGYCGGAVVLVPDRGNSELFAHLTNLGYLMNTDSPLNGQISFAPQNVEKPWGGYKKDQPINFYYVGVVNGAHIWAAEHREFGYF